MRRTSPDVLSVKEHPFFHYQTLYISCRSLRCIPVHKHLISDRLTANCGTVGIRCYYTQCSYTQPYSAWIEGACWLLLIPFWLVANYIIFRTSLFFTWSSSSPFHNSQSWLQNHLNHVRLQPNWAEQQPLQPLCHPVRHSGHVDTSWSTATLQL